MNLKGVIVGNGFYDNRLDSESSMFEFFYMHNVISRDTYFKWRDNGCYRSEEGVYPNTDTKECNDAWDEMEEITKGINWYDIYRNGPYEDRMN